MRTFFNQRLSDFEQLDSESLTIPDMSLSVREILQRFTRGQMEVPDIETGEDEDFEDYNGFDDLSDAVDAYRHGAGTLAVLSQSEEPRQVDTESSAATEKNEPSEQ
ncbi:hypothetical protein [Peromfec virus RodF7_14]|uniref:Uncharacterized protein n=1 Tax=Peromfec virus RodF7_14 TaxID=2929349 RepID=A0A976N203_9VIRU|nr:hypothetical protein [Peromfec virus RodF7_14]